MSIDLDQGYFAADAVVDRLRETGQYSVPPFPIEAAATSVGIVQVVRTDMRHSGRLIPVGARFVVELKSSEHPVRQRFTLAHEVAHVLVASMDDRRGLEDRLLRCRQDLALERICDAMASRLLLPPSDFDKVLSAEPLTLAGMARMAKRFNVSWQTLAIAVAALRRTHTTIGWSYDQRLGSPRRAYRVAWAATPRGVFVPQQDACRPDCIVETNLPKGTVVSANTRLDLGSLRGVFDVEVRAIGRIGIRRPDVVMLVNHGQAVADRRSAGRKEAESPTGIQSAPFLAVTPLGMDGDRGKDVGQAQSVVSQPRQTRRSTWQTTAL